MHAYKLKTETYMLPTYWASYFMNADETGYSNRELREIHAFEADMVERHGQCWCLDVTIDGTDFRKYHDATEYGVLACDVAAYTFDVTKT